MLLTRAQRRQKGGMLIRLVGKELQNFDVEQRRRGQMREVPIQRRRVETYRSHGGRPSAASAASAYLQSSRARRAALLVRAIACNDRHRDRRTPLDRGLQLRITAVIGLDTLAYVAVERDIGGPGGARCDGLHVGGLVPCNRLAPCSRPDRHTSPVATARAATPVSIRSPAPHAVPFAPASGTCRFAYPPA